MIKKKSLQKNFIYKFVMLAINILFPLVTAPYVSRILGANNLGKFNFAQATVSMAIVIAGLGISTYGIREVSKVRDNKERLSKIVSEILILSAISTIFFSFIYLIAIIRIDIFKKELLLFVVFGLNLLFSFLSLDWFYSGIEEFKYITNRNIAVKLLGFIFLFIFVKSKNDYINYAIIYVFTTIVINIYNIIYMNKYVKITLKNLNLKKHFFNTRFFYITLLMGSVYGILDQVLVGILSNSTSVALYTRAKMIGQLSVQITSAISMVLLPRLSNIYNHSRIEYIEMIKRSYRLIIMISLPIMIGLMFLSKDLMFLLGGPQFVVGYKSLNIIAIWTFFVSIAVFTDNQVLIPLGKEKYTTIACFIVGIVSLILNLLLIPKFGYNGSAIALLAADLSGMIFQIYFVKKLVNFKFINSYFIKYLFSCFIMTLFLLLIINFITNIFLRIIISILFSGIIYFGILYIFNDNEVRLQINKIFNRLINSKIKKSPIYK